LPGRKKGSTENMVALQTDEAGGGKEKEGKKH
jgi:hypothetical protein